MSFSERIKLFLSKAWDYIKAARIELIVLAGALALDLIVKSIIGAVMEVGQCVTVIPNFFNLRYVLNTKAAFGSAFGLENFLSDGAIRIIFLIITVLAVAFFAVFMYKSRSKHIIGRLGMALIIAGALGNFADRLFLGYVRDFAEIVFFGFDLPLLGTSFAIFNIADMALIGGVVLFLIYFIFFFDDKKDKKPQEERSSYTLIEETAGADGGKSVQPSGTNTQTSDNGDDAGRADMAETENIRLRTDGFKTAPETYGEGTEGGGNDGK